MRYKVSASAVAQFVEEAKAEAPDAEPSGDTFDDHRVRSPTAAMVAAGVDEARCSPDVDKDEYWRVPSFQIMIFE